jgi:sec-independent protein translocase protein TatA
MDLWIILGILSGWEIVIIVAVVLLLFGGKKIPELMKGLGKGVKEFKDGINNIEEDKKIEDSSTEKK